MSQQRAAGYGTRRSLAAAVVAALTVLAGAWWLHAGRGGPTSEPGESRALHALVPDSLRFPEEVRQAAAEIRELYEFAARRPDVLRYMPCFCGCWRDGHRSNYDCFIDEVHPDGRVDIDEMGFT